MDDRLASRRTALLAEIGRDASIERSDFLVRAGEQLQRFLGTHRDRIRELGGLTLIDDDPDYLAVAPDGSFRSRARVWDEDRNDWVAETETIGTAAELVEIYNPADILQAFMDAREGAGDDALVDEDGAADEGPDAGEAQPGPAAPGAGGADPWAGAADWWAAGQPEVPEVRDEAGAAAALYDLTLDFQERSQRAEAGLLEQFENAASGLLRRLPAITIVEDDDEHLTLDLSGFRGKVIPEGERGWHDLKGPDEVVRFYDPTDVFGDLAEAIAEAWPEVADDGPDDAAGAAADDAAASADDAAGTPADAG
ncbi:MAG TPA: hypothetical protein VGJ17_00020 [Candidatus Limnocylindrales bacterium]